MHNDLLRFSVQLCVVCERGAKQRAGWTWWAWLPHGRIQGEPFRVVQFLIQQCDTRVSVFITHENTIVHIVHEIKIPRQPVDRHLLHICTQHIKERRTETNKFFRQTPVLDSTPPSCHCRAPELGPEPLLAYSGFEKKNT